MKRSLACLLTLTALGCALIAPLPALAQERQLSQAEIEEIVKKVIRENPELLIKTVQEYQQAQAVERISRAAQNLTMLQDKIAHDPRSPSIGNPKGDVTVTEFFDYHCGYCKRFYPELAKLLNDDKKLHVVFKEFPILSPDSAVAAKAALAVWNIDKSKYFDYHIRLMQSNNEFTDEVLTDAAKQEGIDPEEFHKALADPALDKDLDANKVLAASLDISGTPGIIIGTQLMPGAVSYDKLKAAVDEARDSQNQHSNIKKEE